MCSCVQPLSAARSEATDSAAGGAALTPVNDEERRKKLREVELACARLEAELEEEGLGKEEIVAK